jgi:hypothetical protein
MIEMRDAMRAVVEQRSGDVVLATETSIGAWAEITDWRNNPPGPSRPMREAAPVAREALRRGEA